MVNEQNTDKRRYIGRFAPSPTGPLHMGSLVAALSSYLDARHNHGSWLLRIEDLDPPREVPGIAENIIQCLDLHGLQPDTDTLFQSSRSAAYQSALEHLRTLNKLFFCDCSRSRLSESPLYPGYCRQKKRSAKKTDAFRVLASDITVKFTDPLQGQIAENIASSCGDFIVRRRDGLFAYQLAVVVDDHHQGITHVVRGQDLLSSTSRQIYLQEVLGYATPNYCHVPLILGTDGKKLSKQNLAKPISIHSPIENIKIALKLLNQNTSAKKDCRNVNDLLAAAAENWDLTAIGTSNRFI